jgi:adenylate kinase family enzyme
MNQKTFIFIGPSGCGKGTQIELLEKYIKENDEKDSPVVVLETGKLFREFVEKDIYSARLSEDVQHSGGLQPEFLAIYIWSSFFIENMKGKEHLFVDGSPRTESEAYMIDTAMKFYKRDAVVVNMVVSDKWSTERLLARGRNDDTEKGIVKRLEWYKKRVVPAVDYFKDNGYKVFDINGEQTIEEVHDEIMKKVDM